LGRRYNEPTAIYLQHVFAHAFIPGQYDILDADTILALNLIWYTPDPGPRAFYSKRLVWLHFDSWRTF
jgi:hypothetical protein